jgi:multiple sugar transport system substrate-binding protein/sn-glycerol 3-phosphate transport system substrate-binding protein
MFKKLYPIFVVLIVGALMLAACGPKATPTEEAMDVSGTTVTFWHVWGTGSVNEAMLAIVDDFNANNEYGITVEPLDQGGYSDLEDAMNAAIQSGDLPNIVTGYTNALANWASVDVMADFNDFINDPDYGLTAEEQDALYTNALAGGQLADGMQIGWPISQSANVLYYNESFAQDLGFDSAPTTPAEFKEQVCAAAEYNNNSGDPDLAGTGGLVMYASASNYMSWLYAFGGDGLNDAGDGYYFASEESIATATFLKDLWDSGCTLTTESYPNPEFATRKALFVMSSTAGLPYQITAFEDAGSDDAWSFEPFVGNAGMAVNGFGQYVGVVNTTPEENMASWLFVKYLTSPEAQATWIEGSAYFPTQDTTLPLIQDYVDANPIWSSGLDLTQYAGFEPALASWTSVRRALDDAFNQILQAESPDAIPGILEQLDATAAELVAELE